ncbi:hypothetical protein [Streptomonospora wellingtoniae]|uniref:ABM domain-containing protein n=1 Tax=Streptomonospora wellingtoniae TaxID=3075544 RepID=A0ABU2KX85_9ACTN|nr:hypothetical protein [Streptomonospora sp. DSM 45055]MDT0303855.1 hypothetical protein [Streptomonospora sp. DSM 45055]
MFTCELRPEAVDENLALLQDVYAELESVRPPGLRYETLQADDGVTFVALVELDHGPEALQGLEAFQRYRSTLEERCVRPPAMTVVREVGAYPAP